MRNTTCPLSSFHSDVHSLSLRSSNKMADSASSSSSATSNVEVFKDRLMRRATYRGCKPSVDIQMQDRYAITVSSSACSLWPLARVLSRYSRDGFLLIVFPTDACECGPSSIHHSMSRYAGSNILVDLKTQCTLVSVANLIDGIPIVAEGKSFEHFQHPLKRKSHSIKAGSHHHIAGQ